MTETDVRRPFGAVLDDNEEIAMSSDDDAPARMRRPSGFRKSLSIKHQQQQQQRRRRRSSARFLRLAGNKFDDNDEDDDDDDNDDNAPAQQELGEMYKKAIQLNAENKLNSKNSWGLRLIENLDKFLEDDETVENEKEKRVNFTKASCTLDASVKIYSYRVDDVHLTSYKVLANLNRSDETKKHTKKVADGDDEGEGYEKKASSNTDRRTCGLTETLETNLGKLWIPNKTTCDLFHNVHRQPDLLFFNEANINLNKLDSAFDIDPLFHKMSKTFDEGGAKGLLLANLGVSQHGCNIVFDSKEAEEEKKCNDDDQLDEEGLIDISSLSQKLHSILGEVPLESLQLVPQLRTLREEFHILNKEGFVDNHSQKKGRRYASSYQEEKEAEMSIHQDALERSRVSQGNLAVSRAIKTNNSVESDDEHEFAPDNFGADDDDDDDDLEFTDFIAADVNGGRYSSISFQNEPFVDDAVLGVEGSQTTTFAMLNSLFSGDAQSGNEYQFYSQATLEKLSQGNNWAGSQHWKKTDRIRRKRAQTTKAETPKRKKPSKERIFVDLSAPINMGDTIQPAVMNKRGTDPIQLSKAMKVKYSKCYNLLPLDACFGIKQLSTLFLRPNAVVRPRNAQSTDRGNKTVGFQAIVDTFGDGDSWDNGDDDSPGFTLADENNDDFVVKELEGVRKVQKTRVGYASIATIVDVKRLKKDLWSELESNFVPKEEGNVTGEETGDVGGGDTKPLPKEELSKISFNDTIMEMSISQSQNDVTLPFYFICLLHLANEKGLRLESQGLNDFIISVDDGAEPSVGSLPYTASASRSTRKDETAAIIESDDDSDSQKSMTDEDE